MNDLTQQLDLSEELIAAALAIVVPRLMGQVRDAAISNDHGISRERLAIHVLSRLLQQKLLRN